MIKKGDNVMIIAGKDKGKTGKVEAVFPKQNKAIVEGLNVSKRHRKSRRTGTASSIVDIASPLHISNLKKADK